METATRPVPFRPELVEASTHVPTPGRSLTVTATYFLSEAGRKASLLAGGNGRSVQRIEIAVPANRLHLVSVNRRGVARLKLQPRYELTTDQRLVCIDAPPAYDTPPTVEDLLRAAARNHQLESAFHAERTAAQTKRSEGDRARRSEIALAFLRDDSQRAVIHPSPTPKRCYVDTAFGRLRFHVDIDDGPARDVPREALRRFRADVNAARERRERERTEHVRVHEERKQTAAAWVAEHGTADQRARHAAGLLPIDDICEAMADQEFASITHLPRYTKDGVEVMRSYVQHWTGRPVEHVTPNDFIVFGHPARSATSHEWALLEQTRALVRGAVVSLHIREFAWRRGPGVPRLTRPTIVVTKQLGPIVLRREYVVPAEGQHTGELTDHSEGAA